MLPDIKSEIKYEIMGILILTTSVFALISLIATGGGAVGDFVFRVLSTLFGKAGYILPFLSGFIGLFYVFKRQSIHVTLRFIGIVLGFILFMPMVHLTIAPGSEIAVDTLKNGQGGGLIGGLIVLGMRKLFGISGTYIVIFGLAIVVVLMITNRSLRGAIIYCKDSLILWLKSVKMRIAARKINRDVVEEKSEEFHYEMAASEDEVLLPAYTQNPYAGPPQHELVPKADKGTTNLPKKQPDPEVSALRPKANSHANNAYRFPSLNLLSKSRTRASRGGKEIGENANILEETLKSFNVSARVTNISQGPAVTRYELQPAAGVKVSRIVNLADDIALKLAAPGIRIEAPIPGKAAIGIEVPNKDVSAVLLRDILESPEFQNGKSKLTVALGKDIAGAVIIADLGKMPHLLVAGATGSGKSVCINTLILSLMYKATPEEVKLILIDPKMVELSNFNGIPHLVTPVVTDPKKASSALRWAVQEMERRYTLFAQSGVRDINRYNELNANCRLPLIVLIIDELADLMMVSPVDVEDAICRLAQMARACGIHLVLATQRPSVDVITGIIKANIPSRIAFAVSSQVDSRTILDSSGAEKLLGKGDMLFHPVGSNKPIRVQGAFVPDSEVEQVIEFVKAQGQPQYDDSVTTAEVAASEGGSCGDDQLLSQAIQIVMDTGHASTSMLQRRLRIGYTRAARLVDMMEEMKIVGPNIGSKARDIIMTSDQVQAKFFSEKKEVQ